MLILFNYKFQLLKALESISESKHLAKAWIAQSILWSIGEQRNRIFSGKEQKLEATSKIVGGNYILHVDCQKETR